MIQFSLICDNGHSFDSWFKSAKAFEKLNSAGMVSCSLCGSVQVEKAIMAPRVRTSKQQTPSLRAENSPAEQALKELRNYVEKNSDYIDQYLTSLETFFTPLNMEIRSWIHNNLSC